MKRQLAFILFISLFASSVFLSGLILVGCGGGGGGGGGVLPSEPTPSGSNWDEMVWDQDNWG